MASVTLGSVNRQLPVNAIAIAIGGHVRAGLEDNPWLGVEGSVPATNLDLAERTANAAAVVGRGLATPAESRALLSLGPGPAAAPPARVASSN